VPKLRPNHFSLLGIRFSDKSLAYFLAAQLALNAGLRSLGPAAVGVAAGLALYADVGRMSRLLTCPRPVRGFCRRFIRPLLESEAPLTAAGAADGQAGGEAGSGPQRAFRPMAGQGQGLAGSPTGSGGGRRAGTASQRGGAFAGGDAGTDAADGFPGAEPDPSAVDRLVAMGFGRGPVEAALRAAFNNEEAAVHRLLAGS
jgi:hypothetical protein